MSTALDFTSEEVEFYKELSKRLNCFITVQKGDRKMEFWGPYYNRYEAPREVSQR